MASCGVRSRTTFQFTHPGGVRRGPAGYLSRRRRFNSRTREGCDFPIKSIYLCDMGFNSRTREGCDGKDATDGSVSKEFQFTHPGGVRHIMV